MKYSKCLGVLAAVLLAFAVTEPRAFAAEKEVNFDTKMVTLPSGMVEVIDTGGKGVPLLLLHPAGVHLWEKQIPAFAKAGYRVIAVDTRDHTAGATPESFITNKGATRLDDLVTQLNLPKFHLLGTDGNGFMAMQYARGHADKLRSLVLSGTLGGLRDPDVNALEESLRPAPFNDLPLPVRYISAVYRAANPAGTKRWLELQEQGNAAVPPAPMQPLPPGGVSAIPMPNPLTIAKLEEWSLPTMMITGDADLYTPSPIMHIFVSHVKHGEGVVVHQAAHATYWENPEEYNRAVLTFIRKH